MKKSETHSLATICKHFCKASAAEALETHRSGAWDTDMNMCLLQRTCWRWTLSLGLRSLSLCPLSSLQNLANTLQNAGLELSIQCSFWNWFQVGWKFKMVGKVCETKIRGLLHQLGNSVWILRGFKLKGVLNKLLAGSHTGLAFSSADTASRWDSPCRNKTHQLIKN